MNSNELSSYYFHQGTNFFAYEYLGCNVIKEENEYIYSFRTWAPNADEVDLISDFTGWDSGAPLKRVTVKGVWECLFRSPISLHNSKYKFKITSRGKSVNKADPYARLSVGGSDGASVIYHSDFTWSDRNYLKYRNVAYNQSVSDSLSAPINIYEVHLESFMRDNDGRPLSYIALADILSEYCKAMGYTHVELLPIMEHPFSGSWGYQICAYYAPTSRFGTPDEFRYFVNKLHMSGVGVILDWVPAHFPKDEWGLYEFDGCPLYEYQGRDRIESRTWGTRFFDLGREEVQSFLISNALYYLREFHVDGLRYDAVASMIYLDYDREPGEWIRNTNGGNINLEATAFLKKLNSEISAEFPDVLMIAEESGDIGNVTLPIDKGGLGFSLKWNMGFANDFYDYVMTNPLYRKYKHKALNFPIMYTFKERYCLPISHDEVVHGKLSYIDKMYGEYEDKFLTMRASLLMFMTYPGKKLTFMGTELAQFREWDYKSSVEWFMLDYPNHLAMREYVRSLNHFYLERNELWEIDFDSCGFEWLLADECEKNAIAYRRISKDGESLIVAINFSGIPQTLSLKTQDAKHLELVFSSLPVFKNQKYDVICENGKYYCELELEKLSGAVFKENNGERKLLL